MNTQTPNGLQEQNPQHVLEERLKIHIKREFDLGEKVIALLKQKKTLESHLQEQFQTKTELERQLTDIITSKRTLEEQFAEVQRELRERQKALRRRSRRIIEHEEGSREDLKALRQEIHHLREQLELMDTQKVEEHVQLSNRIQALCAQESRLKAAIQHISQEKEGVEEEFESAIGKFQELATAHEHEKAEYEQQIERLQRKQAHLEIQIAHLFDEQQRNEQKLQQEIATLKQSKAELEAKLREKIELLRQQPTEIIPDPDAEFRHLLQQKENYIQELQEKAHQRSAMLRAENANLKHEVQAMLSAHEKITWENQMLESSLKGLQNELAEYLQLKNKFEEVQKEKEHFEATFYKKMKFLEAHDQETGEAETDGRFAPLPPEQAAYAQKLPPEPVQAPDKAAPKETAAQPRFGRDRGKKAALKLLIPALAFLALLAGLLIYTQFPWDNGPVKDSQNTLSNVPKYDFELPEETPGAFEDELLASTPAPVKESPASSTAGDLQKESPASSTAGDLQKARKPDNKAGGDATPTPPPKKKQAIPKRQDLRTTPLNPPVNGGKFAEVHQVFSPRLRGEKGGWCVSPERVTRAAEPPNRPVEIVVQLHPIEAVRFLPEPPKPLPTIANNSILRRHQAEKFYRNSP